MNTKQSASNASWRKTIGRRPSLRRIIKRRSSIDMIKAQHESDPQFQHTMHGRMALAPMNVKQKTFEERLHERRQVASQLAAHIRSTQQDVGTAGGRPATAGNARHDTERDSDPPVTAGDKDKTRASRGGAGKQLSPEEKQLAALRRGRRARSSRARRRPSWLQPHFERPPTALAAQLDHYDRTLRRMQLKAEMARRRSMSTTRFAEYMNRHKGRIRDIFDRFDTDGNGVLTILEFQAGLAELGLPMTEEEVARTVHAVNPNCDTRIEHKELKAYLSEFERQQAPKRGKALQKRPKAVRVLSGSFWKRLGGVEDEKLYQLANTMVPCKQWCS